MAEPKERATKKRGAIKSSTTKLMQKVEDELSKTNCDVAMLEEYFKQLEMKEMLITDLDQKIEDEIVDLEDLESEVVGSQEYRDKIIACKSRINRKIRARPQDHQDSNNLVHSNSRETRVQTISVKLPRIELKKFYGDSCNWQEFWNQFEASIHSNQDLATTDKFSYLNSYLEGAAARAVNGLPITEGNYEVAIQILRDRFGRKDIVVNSHMTKLLNLPPVKRSSDVESLRRLYDACEIQIRSLEGVGVISETYGNLLCPVLMQLIPEDITLEYNRSRKGDTEWDVLDLLNFLRQEVESRERTRLLTKPTEQIAEGRNTMRSNNMKNDYRTRQHQRLMTPSAAALVNNAETRCVYCSKAHHASDCKHMNLQEKKDLLRKQGRCFICLGKSHIARYCKLRWKTCSKCGKHHHCSLCDKNDEASLVNEPDQNTVMSYQSTDPQRIMLQTVRARAEGLSRSCVIRCLLDGGSQRTFVQEHLAQKLNLPVVGEESLMIHTFGCQRPERTTRKIVRVTLRDLKNPERYFELEALLTPKISSATVIVPSETLVADARKIGIELSDQVSKATDSSMGLSLLIGSDFYWRIVTGRMERMGTSLVAMESLFGWTLQGPTSISALVTGVTEVCINKITTDECSLVSDNLRRFWELEHLGIVDKIETATDNQAIQMFESSISKTNGRYEVSLPWDPNRTDLGDNLSVAKARFDSLTRRFRRDVAFYARYNEIIKEQLEQGIVEEVRDQDETHKGKVYYLPHHAICREDKQTTKIRIVYDASSHEEGRVSLNDCLLSGPNLNPNLLKLLLNFRKNRIAFIADIEKAFHQISVSQEDRDALRFLWYKTSPFSSLEPETLTLRMTRVLFGATSSPFILAATIKYHLKDYKESHPLICDRLEETLYVDDFISGADNQQEAEQIQEGAIEIFKDAGMNLRKWKSNSSSITVESNTEGDANEAANFNFENTRQTEKVLGLIWDNHKDEFLFDLKELLSFLTTRRNTKRCILQTTSRIFDPIGFLTPFTVRAKSLFQELWKRGIPWDDELPIDLETNWNEWCCELQTSHQIKIPRWYFPESAEAIPEYELHIFSDASPQAYGAVLYVRYTGIKGILNSALVCSKCRVAPLKTLSLPRLELMGAVIASRLAKFAREALKKDSNVFFWTDSTIVLHWLKGSPTRWKPFVSNRVIEIQALTNPLSWSHCPGFQNPADLLTHGQSMEKLRDSALWWFGPHWLREDKMEWPVGDYETPAESDLLICERRKTSDTLQTYCSSETEAEPLFNLENYSSLIRVLRITAWIQRACENMKPNKEKKTGPLVTEEIMNSRLYWIRKTQEENFSDDLGNLKNGKTVDGESKLRTLNPVLDSHNLICLNTRLHETNLSIVEKQPWILPHNSRFSQLVVMRCHEEVKHSGVTETLAQVRESFWILRGRQLVKTLISRCYLCKRLKVKPITQTTAPLPRDRIIESPPFEITGVDFAGPLLIRQDNGVRKAYIVLFTCAVTRAVHLELVLDMTTPTFLLSFRRFVARRGICKVLYSDNARTFKRSKEELRCLWNKMDNQDLQNYFGTVGVRHKFIVERAAWWGGFWERLVRSVKMCLKKTLGKTSLTQDEMITTLAEVEAILNSRPLIYTYSQPGEPSPLTPSHFLIGQRITALPSEKTGQIVDPRKTGRNELTARLRYRENILNHFWKRWKAEYLLDLRSFNLCPGEHKAKDIEKDDVVLIQHDKTPRHLWPMGRIIETYPGRDNRVRACSVRTSTGTVIRRPVQLLYPFELK